MRGPWFALCLLPMAAFAGQSGVDSPESHPRPASEVAAGASKALRLSAKGAETPTLQHAADVLRQCSRNTPRSTGSFWIPSKAQIAELEAGLELFLARGAASKQAVPDRAVVFDRQYIGFVRDGVNYIYGNFFPASFGGSGWVGPSNVCDGGPNFWGIVYRVDTRSFEEPQFNGVA